jgi:hypothetical protein
MLRAGVDTPVDVIMAEIPQLAGQDRLTTAGAQHAASGDDRRPALAKLLMAVAVTARGRVRHQVTFGPPRCRGSTSPVERGSRDLRSSRGAGNATRRAPCRLTDGRRIVGGRARLVI